MCKYFMRQVNPEIPVWLRYVYTEKNKLRDLA